MFIDRFEDVSPLACGHQLSFERVSNVLDLALAAAEVATALEDDFGCRTEATAIALAFVDEVKRAPSIWADSSRAPYRTDKLSVQHWTNYHARCLADAETVTDHLIQHAHLAINEAHLDPLNRLQRKMAAGKVLLA